MGTGGKPSVRALPGGTQSRGGNGLPFGDQEAVSRDAEGRVMMEAAPTPPFEVIEAEFLLEVLIVPFDAPAQLGPLHQRLEGGVLRQGGEPEAGRRGLLVRPLDQEPLGGPLRQAAMAMGRDHAHPGEASRQRLGRALSPGDGAPGLSGQALGDIGDRGHVPLPPAALGPGVAGAGFVAGGEHQRVGHDACGIGKAKCRHAEAQLGVMTVAGIHQHHAARQALGAGLLDLRQRDLRLGREADLGRHPALCRRSASSAQVLGR